MRKIVNPYAEEGNPNHKCFACSPTNDIGLKLEFWDAGDEVIAEWIPDELYQGYVNILHGGIQATLLDEIASWVVCTKCETVGVTVGLDISYKRPVRIDEGKITLRASLKELNGRIAVIDARLLSADGKLASYAVVKYFIFPLEKAKSDFHYPGVSAFYEAD